MIGGDKQEGRLQCEKVRDIMGDLFTDAEEEALLCFCINEVGTIIMNPGPRNVSDWITG